MINVLMAHIDMVGDHEIESCLRFLPTRMQGEIRRYKYIRDRKSSLLGRLLLHHCLASEGKLYLLDHWKRDGAHKPYIPGWHSFNISHSGDLVLFSVSEAAIGVDIEHRSCLDYHDLSVHFHWEEQQYIRNAFNTQEAFYELWVKKEAALKAMGTGIANGLKRFSCVGSHLDYMGTSWYLRPLPVDPAYTAYICTTNSTASITIKKCLPNLVKNLY